MRIGDLGDERHEPFPVKTKLRCLQRTAIDNNGLPPGLKPVFIR